MLEIVGTLTATRVEHREAALPVSYHVPNRRQALEALDIIQGKQAHSEASVVTMQDAVDVIHRFVLTR
jgi:hypothetical protein